MTFEHGTTVQDSEAGLLPQVFLLLVNLHIKSLMTVHLVIPTHSTQIVETCVNNIHRASVSLLHILTVRLDQILTVRSYS